MNVPKQGRAKNRLAIVALPFLLSAGLYACGGGGGGGGNGGSANPPTSTTPPPRIPGVYLIAGSACIECSGTVDGMGGTARFNKPAGIAADAAGNLYVAEPASGALRKVTPQGQVTTFGNSAGFQPPTWLDFDLAGQLYVTDRDHNTVRKVTLPSQVDAFAGSGACDSGDGAAASAGFCKPNGIAVDKTGNVYVSDMGNHLIRKVTPAGVVSTLAGTKGVCGSADGTGASAQFCEPHDLAVDDQGNLFVADTGNATIRKISAAGQVTTVAGSPGQCGFADGSGAAARFCGPQGVALDRSGNLYVTDTYNYVVRKITAAGIVTTVAGVAGTSDTVIGALPGGFSSPLGIVVLDDDTLAVASGHAIVKVVLPH
jgi:sugar lactone lactonase YvrE